MKFLVIGDLHGQKPKLYFKDFDAVIAPGDFCSDEARNYMFQVMRDNLNIEWYDLIGKKKAREIVKSSVKKGREILEYLNSLNVPVYLVPGNNDWVSKSKDWTFLDGKKFEKMREGLNNIINVENKVKDIGDYLIVGYGRNSRPEVPPYEIDLKNYTKPEIKKLRGGYNKKLEKFDKILKKAKMKKKPIIFLSHNVPFNTPLDKITNKNSPRYGYHYGSLVTKEIIKKHQPLVCIGGHMHEHFKKHKIGKTIAINSGYGGKVNIEMVLDNNKIKKLKFYGK